MDFWIKAAQLVLSLSILVVLHELGHFIPAKLFKTRVEKFYLFFNPWFSLAKKKIGETEWGIGWLPLGGYVKISGMIDESMDKEQMKQPAQPWEFRSKPAWQRLIIMVGGVTVNIILGFLIYIFVFYTWGEEKVAVKDLKAGLTVHPYMEKYGLVSGDYILEVDGEKVEHPNDINAGVFLRDKRNLTVRHANGQIEDIKLPEEIDFELFRNSAYPMVSLRSEKNSIDHISFTSNLSDIGLKTGDYLLKIDGENLNDIEDPITFLENKNKTVKISVLRGSDSINLQLPYKLQKLFLQKSPALTAGLKHGDLILSVNGKEITYHDEIQGEFYKSKKKIAAITYLRGNDTILTKARISSNATLGYNFESKGYVDSTRIKKSYYSFGQSIGKGFNKGILTLGDYVGQLKFIFTKKGAESVGGFASIGNMFAPVWDWEHFWMTTALISIILAFMNILPIPALDGGHVVFLLYEIITRKEAPQKVLEYAQYVGFFLLMGLLLYANGNDLYRWLFN